MAEFSGDQFQGFEHNTYQENMHHLAITSLWLIIVAGVACGIFGFIWGISH